MPPLRVRLTAALQVPQLISSENTSIPGGRYE